MGMDGQLAVTRTRSIWNPNFRETHEIDDIFIDIGLTKC